MTNLTDHLDEAGLDCANPMWASHHYEYGKLLGSHGIGVVELMEDWPEALHNADIMRGWQDGFYRQAEPAA
ncbi:MAG TPA: hypothetical protein VNY75_03110 [Rhizomicrobium sp.]|jgi:hypothetical protein|nr:hypothetical protein [Rhizomicrobium sp.]